MGTVESPFELEIGMEVNLPGGVFVVANAADIARLNEEFGTGGYGGASLIALDPGLPLPANVIEAARLLVVEVDPGERASLRRIAQIRDQRPHLPVIVALRDASRTLVRQGVADVADLPFNSEELTSQILDAIAAVQQVPTDAPLAPLISVVRSTGGAGATTVLTHLAAALAREHAGGKGVCVIDLDLQGGDVVQHLGKRLKFPVTDLLDAGERLDAELMRGSVTDSGHGFAILAAPDAITPLETVDADQLLRLVTIARSQFGVVLVDLPTDWTGWALSVALACNEILLVTGLSIGSLRQAKRRIDLLTSVGFSRRQIKVVVNRVERRLFKTIGVEEVHQALGCDVVATLADEGHDLSSAQDEGLLITETRHKSRFGQDIAALASQLAATER